MKKYFVLLVSILLLAGCTQFSEPITSNHEGILNEYIVWPIVQAIHMLSGMAGSYAGGIIVVTILIRVLILPLTLKQVKSAKAMQVLQPQLKALKEKYPSKDAATQEKYQKELMQSMQKSGVNPLGGCMPVLIQMPILIGLYHAISRMNVTPVFELGAFLGVSLANNSAIFAIVAGLAQLAVLKTSPSTGTNPQMASMKYVLPIMIVVFGFISPAAIALYWIVSSCISVIQNFYIYKVRY